MIKISSQSAQKFLDYLNYRFGVFLDSIQGFENNYNQLIKLQHQGSKLFAIPLDQLDRTPYIRSNFNPTKDNLANQKLIKHSMTQADFKKNNIRNGLNSQTAIDDCLCAFFNYWDEFKKEELKKKGISDQEVLPLLNYLKLIRNRLSHNKYFSAGEKDIPECPLNHVSYTLPSFDKEKSIELRDKDIDAILDELRIWLEKQI